MRLCGIGCKDYICISTEVNERPGFFKLDSTDSLVMPSNAPDGIGFPISHLESVKFYFNPRYDGIFPIETHN